MASSLDVIRQTQQIPGMPSSAHYRKVPPVPPAHRRWPAPGALGGNAATQGLQKRILPTGITGHHSWSATSAASAALLSNRFQRLNLRLSAPTPGEEELCRHWMQNSAKFCRRSNEADQTRIKSAQILPSQQSTQNQIVGGQTRRFERPITVQTPLNHRSREPPVLPKRGHSAGPRKIVVNIMPQHEYMTSSDSDRITSPSASQRSSPGMRKIQKQVPTLGRPSTSSYTRGDSRGDSPSCDQSSGRRQDNGDVRSQPRPPSARPGLRSRTRTPHSPQYLRSGSSGKDGAITRRWSFSETMLNQQNANDAKDDDSAYSSSRDVTINIEKGHVMSINENRVGYVIDDVTDTHYHPGKSSAEQSQSKPKLQKTIHVVPKISNTKQDGGKHGADGSKVKLSGQGGRPVYYHAQAAHDRATNDSRVINHEKEPPLSRNTTNSGRLLPLRRGNVQQRPVTQPPLGSPHSRAAMNRKSHEEVHHTPSESLIQRVLPNGIPGSAEPKTPLVEYHVGTKFYPISPDDFNILYKQRRPVTEQRRQGLISHPSIRRDVQPVTHYMDPEVNQRVIQWLASVEQNPEVYYGFETDLFETYERKLA